MPQSLSWDSGLAWDKLTPGIAWDDFVTITQPKRPVASDNRISIEVTPAQNAAIVAAIGALRNSVLTAEMKMRGLMNRVNEIHSLAHP